MPRRRGTAIGFVLVTILSFLFSVWSGRRIAYALDDFPLARVHPLTGDYLKDWLLPPRNFPASQLGLFFITAPIGISLASGISFARLWQRRSGILWARTLTVVFFGLLLALSAVNIGWSPGKERSTAIQVWISGTMALTGVTLLLLNRLVGTSNAEIELVGLLENILLLFQGILAPQLHRSSDGN
jgi:hypothetical protein